jgi:xylulokinase
MYLGVDIGTSAVKAVVVDEDQRLIASASAPLSLSRPHELWSEQHPDDWWAAAAAAVAELRAAAGPSWNAIRAIGLSGQMHGAVLTDAAGRPLRPAILHNDGRAHAEAEELNRRLPDIGRIAGVPAMPGFAAPKLLWLARHEPAVLREARHLLLPKDYVRLRMSGSYATDMCDASGALLLDCARRAWSPEIAAACGIPLSLLPPVLEGSGVAAALSPSVAAGWGLKAGTLIATGTGDAAAGAIAAGAVNEGDAFISLGTAAQYFVARESYRPAPEHLVHSFCHGLPQRWFQMAALLNGAGALAWAAELLGNTDIGAMLTAAESAFSGPSPLIFLPYLTGERTPHNNAHAKGVLFGLTPASGPAQVTQAVVEGVALALADCQAYVAETGPLPDHIAVNGGGSRSPFWMKILASALRKTVVLQEDSGAGPAFGAARLARLAATGEQPSAVCIKRRIAAEISPDPALADAYGERLDRFRGLYRAVKPFYQ